MTVNLYPGILYTMVKELTKFGLKLLLALLIVQGFIYYYTKEWGYVYSTWVFDGTRQNLIMCTGAFKSIAGDYNKLVNCNNGYDIINPTNVIRAEEW